MMGSSRKREDGRGYRLVLLPSAPGKSSYRVLDDRGEEVRSINGFLDYIVLRGLSERTVRAYGYDLLHFWRWFSGTGIHLNDLSEEILLDYVRSQYEDGNKASAAAINHRLVVLRVFYHFVVGRPLPPGRSLPKGRAYPYDLGPCASTGYLRRIRPRPRSLRVKAEHRVVVPLGPEEVARFLESFHTWRDLAMVGLMLLCGLRSREVLALSLGDIPLNLGQVLVQGKGRKERIVPLPSDVASVLKAYVEVERPKSQSHRLFLCLKGPRRGQPLGPAGLRTIFRYHRSTSGVAKANPHRFRHTFGADMVRAGISLPALMRLMGHTNIRITMLYAELSPQDVWDEFRRAMAAIRNRNAKGSLQRWERPGEP